MYENFYGLTEKPFNIVPNPNFLYLSAKHRNALTYLEYGIREGVGFVLLTGEIGTGKTTLIRHILNNIEDDIEVAVIFNTNVDTEQLLALILQEFELTPLKNDKAGNLDILYQFLIDKYSRKKRVLLIIDEAQNLSGEVLEEVRMLSNLQADEFLLLDIMLVGQPELKIKLRSPALAQLNQRIGVKYHLVPLDREETGKYIVTRLEKAGGSSDLFTEEAVDEIYRVTNGTPRSINLICDTALVYGFADEMPVIGLEIIEQVIADKGELAQDNTSAEPEEKLSSQIQLAGEEINKRLDELEQRLRELQYQQETQAEKLEKQEEQGRREIIDKLLDELRGEREKNEKLLVNYARLKEKHEKSKQESTPVEAKHKIITQPKRQQRKQKKWFGLSF